MRFLNAPWFLALLALALVLGTQVVAFKIYWKELFPPPKDILVVHRQDPSPLHWSFSTEEIEALQRELESRLEKAKEKESFLASYEARLEADRAEVEDMMRNVEIMRDSLLQDVIRLEEAEQRNLKTLAKTYSELDAPATVNIFNELDDATVVKIMFFMKPDIVAEILEEMATRQGANGALVRRAAKLSDMLRLFSENPGADPA